MDVGETFRPQDDEQLDALFRAYREACPNPEASPNFMPQLWQKIEAREHVSFTFGRITRQAATAAVALSLLLAMALSFVVSRPSTPDDSYVEILAEDHARQNLDYFEPVHISPADYQQ